jgi:type IV secretory pathway VirJ component
MKTILIGTLLFCTQILYAQSKDIPIQVIKGNDASKPVLFYISGDGGWNKFSTTFMSGLNKLGFSVIGLNSRSYFWSKKTPQQAANDIQSLLNQYMRSWNAKSFIIIGYSFGADVLPFIQNHFRKSLLDSLNHTVIMSPSKKTDFEVHVLGMIGLGSNGESVPDEINKLTTPVTIIMGSDETDFPIKNITLKNVKVVQLEGGHHYDGHVDELIRKLF